MQRIINVENMARNSINMKGWCRTYAKMSCRSNTDVELASGNILPSLASEMNIHPLHAGSTCPRINEESPTVLLFLLVNHLTYPEKKISLYAVLIVSMKIKKFPRAKDVTSSSAKLHQFIVTLIVYYSEYSIIL